MKFERRAIRLLLEASLPEDPPNKNDDLGAFSPFLRGARGDQSLNSKGIGA